MMLRWPCSLLFLGMPALAPALSLRQEPLSLEASWSSSPSAGSLFRLAVFKLTLDKDWHVNSNKPKEEYLIPTGLTLRAGGAWTLAEVTYPPGQDKTFSFSDSPLSVYEGDFVILAKVSIKGDGKAPPPLEARLRFQACNNRSCRAPETMEIRLPVDSLGIGRDSGADAPWVPAPNPMSHSLPLMGEKRGEGGIAEALASHGFVLTLMAIYVLGLGLCLTPCVYPIIPVTVGYFGSHAQNKLGRQILLASSYGLGIALSYAALGTFAAFSGSLFGSLLQSPWVLGGLSLLCLGLALNAFGLYEISMPQALMQIAGTNYPGVLGSFLMGLTMGIAAAPCVGAFVVGLLAYVGEKRNLLFGFSAFLALGLGLASPFVVLATFSGLASKLPRSGAWLLQAKRLMGILLLLAAVYFGHTLLPMALRDKLPFLSHGGLGPAPDWKPFSSEALDQARRQKRPVIIDFYADWCLPCKELDKTTFRDPEVVSLSGSFLALKADLTREEEPAVADLVRRFGIKGVPTVVFLDAAGKEREDLRLVQFEDAAGMVARMTRAKETK